MTVAHACLAQCHCIAFDMLAHQVQNTLYMFMIRQALVSVSSMCRTPCACRLRPCHLAKTHAALSDLASRQRVLLLSSPPPAAGPPEELLALVAAYAHSAHAAAFAPPPLLQLQDVLGPEGAGLPEEQVC
jgi:hypothetical protein